MSRRGKPPSVQSTIDIPEVVLLILRGFNPIELYDFIQQRFPRNEIRGSAFCR